MMAAYQKEGSLPALQPALKDRNIAIYGDTEAASLDEALRGFLGGAMIDPLPLPYVAIHAYLPPTDETSLALAKLRSAVESKTGRAVTVGYGPRFLHSTGQLHKGDAGHGLFLQLVAAPPGDVPIPDDATSAASSIGFATLIAAQSLGDRKALLDGGRRVLRLDLGTDIESGLATVIGAIA
jgi:hypothetical protein